MRHDGLTDRQLEVASRIAQGLTVKEIAAELLITPRAVTDHINRIVTIWKLNRQKDVRVQIALHPLTSKTDVARFTTD